MIFICGQIGFDSVINTCVSSYHTWSLLPLQILYYHVPLHDTTPMVIAYISIHVAERLKDPELPF